MGKISTIFILIFYCPAALWLFLYGINNYYMVYLFLRKNKKESLQNREFLSQFWLTHTMNDLPTVTTQLPIYNERYVVKRLIDAVVNIDYPKELHEIQVLDDSRDETKEIAAGLVDKYRAMGFNIKHITRENRGGFKAGALNEGLQRAEGEFIAIFDADFVPDKEFLYKTIPFFYEKEKIALVQTRWGHMNSNYSLLTMAQSIGMDGHFIIEQAARSWNGLYMNFNGTAGIWRKEAIIDAGNWQSDTLTEDLDLSYRAQLKGWKTKYLSDVVTPSELPVDANAYKSQQYRWAKGSIQTAKKILPHLIRSNDSLIKKIQAIIHLTQYMVHPMMSILAVFSLPMAYVLKSEKIVYSPVMALLLICLFLGVCAPTFLYIVSIKSGYQRWWKKTLFIPALMCVGTGVTLNNTKAVIEALLNLKSEFIRTPKYGITNRCGTYMKKKYTLERKYLFIFEILLGFYCIIGFLYYTSNNRFIFGPFLLLYAAGFLYTGILSLLQDLKKNIRC